MQEVLKRRINPPKVLQTLSGFIQARCNIIIIIIINQKGRSTALTDNNSLSRNPQRFIQVHISYFKDPKIYYMYSS